jgi:hypothetical protein
VFVKLGLASSFPALVDREGIVKLLEFTGYSHSLLYVLNVVCFDFVQSPLDLCSEANL